MEGVEVSNLVEYFTSPHSTTPQQEVPIGVNMYLGAYMSNKEIQV